TVELKNIDDLIHFLKSWPEKYFKEFSIENVSLFDKVFEKTDIINIIQSIDSYEQIVELLEINPAFIYYILSNAKITPNDTFIYYILSNDELRIFDNNQLIHNLLKNRKNYNKDDAVTALLIEKSISLNVFSDSKKFIELAEINWEMANTLIQYKEIYDLVKNDLPFAYFSSINKEDGMDDKQILENKLQHSFFSSLDLSISPTRRKIKKLEELDLAFDEKKQKDFNREEMVSHFLSTSEFIFEMMYGESGYYSTGKIAFQSHNNTSGDFITTASNYRTRSVFSANMAYQLFNYRKTMIENGVIKSTDFFDVLECGAGEGHLCGAILDAIEAMSKKNSEWKEFHQQIRYTILEKSPALVERQKITNLRHGGKVKYINGDAMQMKNHLSANHYSAVISNELLDMFPPHRVMRTADGQLSTEIMVISINEKAYKEFFETKIINENKQDLTFDNLKQRSDQYKKRLNSFSQQIPAVNNKAMLILNKKDFLKLHTYYSSDPKFSPQKDVKDDISVFSFSNVYVDIIHFPDLQKYMENHPEISSKIKKNKPTLIVLGIDNFILGSEYALKNGGFILSVDYGGNSLEASHDIRTYYKGVSGGHFTRCPGFIDITIDVDFTILVESGKQYGIDLVWFMNQGHVSNDPVFIDLFVNNGILKKVDIDYYILTDGALKACLQSKTKLEELKQSNSIHNTFFLPQSIPVTYAQNFLKRKTDFTKGMDYEKTHNDDKRINSRTF
ncbi:MAG: SAM-dependent methyltransferase, partial [Gammaproteobacteria bacterium]|nr:SAM-dependent methyltransferase [Gammaproteobacteria bacterium]